MLNFYGIEYTSKDQPGIFSIVLYTNGCNFRCYGCHNRSLAGWDYEKNPLNRGSPKIKLVNPEDFYQKLSIEELKLAIENSFIDMVILCGGETLIHNIQDVEESILFIKSLNTNLKIRVDTNGSFPEKVKYLKEKKLADGFAIDIKGPYWNKKYYPDISNVIGCPVQTLEKILPKLIESIHLADGLEFSSFRTVLYPIIKEKKYFEEIKNYCKENLKSPHYFNLFQEV